MLSTDSILCLVTSGTMTVTALTRDVSRSSSVTTDSEWNHTYIRFNQPTKNNDIEFVATYDPIAKKYLALRRLMLQCKRKKDVLERTLNNVLTREFFKKPYS